MKVNCKKKKSKRQTLKLKYNIEKRVAERRRQVKKQIKKGDTFRQAQKKKDIGIPNDYPFKEKILRELQEARDAENLKKEELREERRQMQRKMELARRFVETVRKSGQSMAMDVCDEPEEDRPLKVNDKTKYMKDLQKLLEVSDIVIQVLDARDPQNSRSLAVEAQVVGANKKLILLLNKVDLVPQDVNERWISHLKTQYPTIGFKAAQSGAYHNRENMDLQKAEDGLLTNSSAVIGGEKLLQLLKNYSRNGAGSAGQVTVGVIGFPNVGKSSVINSLLRRKAVNTGGRSGITREIQVVNLDSKLKLVDSPGVLFDQGEDMYASLVLRNALNIDEMKDAAGMLENVIGRFPKQDLILFFKVPDFDTAQEFLMNVAQIRGHMRKGGRLDLESAARSVLRDFSTGKFRFYEKPPVSKPETPNVIIQDFSQSLAA